MAKLRTGPWRQGPKRRRKDRPATGGEMVSRLSSGVTGAMCDSGHQVVAVVPHSRQHRGLRHEDAGVLMGTAQVGEGAAAYSIWRFHGQMGRMTASVRKLQQERTWTLGKRLAGTRQGRGGTGCCRGPSIWVGQGSTCQNQEERGGGFQNKGRIK